MKKHDLYVGIMVPVLMLALLLIAARTEASVTAVNVAARSSYSIQAVPYTMRWLPTAEGVAANSSRYVTRAVAYTPARIGAMARPWLLTPAGFAATAAVIAAGYIVDEITGEVTTPGGVTTGTGYHCTTTGVDTFFSSAEACAAHLETIWVGTTSPDLFWTVWGPCYADGAGNIKCGVGTTSGGVTTTYSTYGYYSGPHADVEVETATSILTDDQLGQLFDEGGLLNDYLPDLLTDPLTGLPLQTTELTDAMQDVESDFNAQYDSDPATVPTTDGLTDTGTETQTDDLVGCAFFPAVCEFFDWFREPADPGEPPAMPVETVTEQNYTSGIGSGTCPTISPVDVQGFSILPVNVQPACDFAGMISYIIVGISYFAAATILLGVKRG